MTAQFHDVFLYMEENFSIAGINGSGLYDPADHGILTVPCSSANWRGFWCVYALRDEKLILQDLELCVDGDHPKVFGVSADEPEKPSAKLRRARYYRNIGKEVLFEGGMLLGAGFISELYVHMGFHPAWKFECVHELIFENGILMEAYDRSETIAAYRERMKGLPLDPGITDERVIKDWIDECFSLDYPSWLP